MLGMDSESSQTPSLTSHMLLKANLFWCIFILYSKSIGPQALIGRWADPRVASSGALAESLDHTLSYICAKVGAF